MFWTDIRFALALVAALVIFDRTRRTDAHPAANAYPQGDMGDGMGDGMGGGMGGMGDDDMGGMKTNKPMRGGMGDNMGGMGDDDMGMKTMKPMGGGGGGGGGGMK